LACAKSDLNNWHKWSNENLDEKRQKKTKDDHKYIKIFFGNNDAGYLALER